jgi:hypothetical protein
MEQPPWISSKLTGFWNWLNVSPPDARGLAFTFLFVYGRIFAGQARKNRAIAAIPRLYLR